MGDDFTTQMETSGTITFVASDNETLILTGLDDTDDTEPYNWTPINNLDVINFANHVADLTG